ncbi:MAG TPA: glycosyltransferase [Pseudonocardiaceae bacterium]|nr:glycosyltransferase [Pseudonocardiaceae bacterium]
MTPRITVICPAYNRSTAILPTIHSVLDQTVPEWELLVVSDASSDDTDDVVRSVGDDRIRLLRVGRYGSPGGPRNTGLAAARAPYVAYLDHDDLWRPGHLAILLDHLDAGEPLVSTGCVRVDAHGSPVERSGPLDRVWHPELQAMNAMYEPSRVAHARQLAAAVGGWSEATAGFEDWDLWFRLAAAGVDFSTAPERTAMLTLDAGTRRHTFGARHAVGLARLADEAHGRRLLDRLAEPDTARKLDECYVDDVQEWFAALAGSARLIRPAGTRIDDLVATVRTRVADGVAGSFLREVTVIPGGGGQVLALPTGPISAAHNSRIRELLGCRHRAQLGALADLVHQTR